MSKYSYIFFLILGSLATITHAQTNQWQESLHSPWIGQVSTTVYDIHFKDNGPFGYGWIYGTWLDLDSNLRLAAYRKGGKWNSISVYSKGPSLSIVTDIVQYGDTLYLCGNFLDLVFESDTSKKIPNTSLIKIFEDSIWSHPPHFVSPKAMTSSGDTLLIWASAYFNDTIAIGEHIMTTDGGKTWQYPYSKLPPGGNFGPYNRFEIWDGKIYVIQSTAIDSIMGVIVWDGNSWEVLGDGIFGTYSRPSNFIFYKDELYMSGHYSKQLDPRNPGDYITKWNGIEWEEFGGGGIVDFVLRDGLSISDSHLVCHSLSPFYGDANIPFIAGWDGQQWCGTPISYTPAALKGPTRVGVINDTLYSFCGTQPLYADGKAMSMLNYFDGDYFKGPLSICSTVGLGIDEESAKPRLELFPNPASSRITIDADGRIPQILRLYNTMGQLIMEKTDQSTLEVPAGLRGVYYLAVLIDGLWSETQVIIE